MKAAGPRRAPRMPSTRAGRAACAALAGASALGIGLAVATASAAERTRSSVMAVTATVPPAPCAPTNPDRACAAVPRVGGTATGAAGLQGWPGALAVTTRSTPDGLTIVTVHY